ncbi:MAG: zinc-binding alcohol dehydrogenase family protein [Planctomycetota bacterium]
MKADAWVLYAGHDDPPRHGELVRESIDVPTAGEFDVIAAPIFGCWEGNMGHAVKRSPIDVCLLRKEPKVVLGNAGVVRIIECGRRVTSVEPGQHALIFCNGEADRWGYPKKIFGYDAPGTIGCLATRMKLREDQVIGVPRASRFSLAQWAAFSLRYITAWSNWEVAYGAFRLLVSREEYAAPNVWGWGGGVTFAQLDLARRNGCRAAMVASNEERLELIARHGIAPVDRRRFARLNYDEARYGEDAEYRDAYRAAESTFLAEVRRLTAGDMVQIFIDYVGTPVYRATLKALSREGVITTAGWKEGMVLMNVRAIECIERHQHIHTHYARRAQAEAAVAYGERENWMPTVDARIYAFDEIPQLVDDYELGHTGYFPCFKVSE